MPDTKDINDLILDFVAPFVMANEDSSHFPRIELLKALADTRLGRQRRRRSRQRLDHTRGGGRIDRCQKIMQPGEVGQPLVGLRQFHQRGAGSGSSVFKLSAQAWTV